MKQLMAWIEEKILHKKKDKLLFDKIETHRELIKQASQATDQLIATLDGENDWLCHLDSKYEEKHYPERRDHCNGKHIPT